MVKKMGEKSINRRDYLKYTGTTIAGLVVGGALGYVLKPSEVIEKTVTTTVEKTVATTSVVKKEYEFHFISHIGPADPNMKWLTDSGEAFMKRYPEVVVKYFAPEEFDIKKQLELLRTSIAAKPDGLIVPITDPTALEKDLKEAIAAGIPVVASNIADPRKPPEKIPYLAYVGGDEYLTGYLTAKRTLELHPEIRCTVHAIPHVGHVGHEMRGQGWQDAMKEALGEKYTHYKLAIGEDATKAMEILTSFLEAHPEVDSAYPTAGWASPWVYNVATKLGRKLVISTVDESPVSIEGILRGIITCTHSQGFWLQNYYPPLILYLYCKYGFIPRSDFITGPIIIDKTNAEYWKKLVMSIFGSETYEKLTLW